MLIGALHATQAGYITVYRGLYKNGIQLSDEDRMIMDNLCAAWTNFARTSDPNPLPHTDIQWKPHTANHPSYMLFDKECTLIKGKVWNEGFQFWKQIFHEYVDWNNSDKRLQI